jgi:hypothetical protein
MLAFMKAENIDVLPSEEWMRWVLTRDFSYFEPTLEEADAGDAQASAKKLEEYQKFLKFFDFYTSTMVSQVAGSKRWDKPHYFVEPMSTALKQDEKPRITPNHEGFVGFLFFNGRKKWMYMHDYSKKHPGKKCPQWSKQKPTELLELKPPYTDQFAGQNPFGGTTHEGRVLFGQLARLVQATRNDHAARILEVEQAAIARLVKTFNYSGESQTKKRKADEISEEPVQNAELLEWI